MQITLNIYEMAICFVAILGISQLITYFQNRLSSANERKFINDIKTVLPSIIDGITNIISPGIIQWRAGSYIIMNYCRNYYRWFGSTADITIDWTKWAETHKISNLLYDNTRLMMNKILNEKFSINNSDIRTSPVYPCLFSFTIKRKKLHRIVKDLIDSLIIILDTQAEIIKSVKDDNLLEIHPRIASLSMSDVADKTERGGYFMRAATAEEIAEANVPSEIGIIDENSTWKKILEEIHS